VRVAPLDQPLGRLVEKLRLDGARRVAAKQIVHHLARQRLE
jgi:hypothetical protein